MICRLFIKPATAKKALFLDRPKQGLLQVYLNEKLFYTPFVFNTVLGVFIFTKKKEDTQLLTVWVSNFLATANLQSFSLVDCSSDPGFFRRFTREVLSNQEASALAWKRYLNSFLIQVNPFKNEGIQGIKVFKRIKKVIKEKGSDPQKKHFKRRLKSLRKGVSLSSIESIIKRPD